LAPPFTDVAPTDFYFSAINFLYAKGIAVPCSTTPMMYCPSADMTRDVMAQFIVRSVLGGDPTSYTQTPYFTDVPASYPYFEWIQALRDLGITDGCTATTYCPGATVTRDQMAAFIIRLRYGASTGFAYPSTPYFTDVLSATDIFFNYVQKLAQVGITSGCTTTTYCPNDLTLRGQMAVFLARGAFNQGLPAGTPVISSVSPATATRGQTVNLFLTGTNTSFVQGVTQVTPVAGITVNSVSVVNSQTLVVQVTIAAGTTAGPRSLIATTASSEAVLPNGLTLQ